MCSEADRYLLGLLGPEKFLAHKKEIYVSLGECANKAAQYGLVGVVVGLNGQREEMRSRYPQLLAR